MSPLSIVGRRGFRCDKALCISVRAAECTCVRFGWDLVCSQIKRLKLLILSGYLSALGYLAI
jgi:hypothetical protein